MAKRFDPSTVNKANSLNEMPNILGHAWPPDLLLKGFDGLSRAEVACEGTAVHFFQEQLPEAMVGRDDELENIQSGRAIQEGQAMHLCTYAELTISRGSTCKISLQGCIFLLTLRNT